MCRKSTWNVKFSVYLLSLRVGEWVVSFTIRLTEILKYFFRGGADSIPRRPTWDFWWAKLHNNCYLYDYMRFVWSDRSVVDDNRNILAITHYWLVICFRPFTGACSVHVVQEEVFFVSIILSILHALIDFFHCHAVLVDIAVTNIVK